MKSNITIFLILDIRYLKVAQQLVRMGRVQNFMFILGRVVLGHFSYGSGWVGSRKLDPRPTLVLLLTVQQTNFILFFYDLFPAVASESKK